MSLEAGMGALKLGYGPLDWDLSLKEEEKKEEGDLRGQQAPKAPMTYARL